MKNKIVFILVFASFLFLSFSNTGLAIDITNCTNLSTENGVYNLTQNITGNQTEFQWSVSSNKSYCINISASNIILDCGGYSILGNSSGVTMGILANNTNNLTIMNCNIESYCQAVYLDTGENHSLHHNNISQTSNLAFTLKNVNRSNVTNNTFLGYKEAVYLCGGNYNIINNNTARNTTNTANIRLNQNSDYNNITNNILYNNSYPTLSRGVYIHSGSDYNRVSNNIISRGSDGININGGQNNTVSWNYISGCEDGIDIGSGSSGSYNNISNNNFYNNTFFGIHLNGAFNITVYNNTINASPSAFRFNGAESNKIIENEIYHSTTRFNYHVMYLWKSPYNLITNNTIYNSSSSVIYFFQSNRSNVTNNTIYGNQNLTHGWGAYLVDSHYNVIDRNTLYDNIYGVFLSTIDMYGDPYGSPTYNIIHNNTLYNSNYGIFLNSSLYNNVTFNTVYNNTRGILFNLTNFSRIINNTAYNSTYGIYLSSSNNNTVENNSAYNTTYAIYTNPSTNNTITFNTAFNSTIGIGLLSSNNTIVRNNTAYDNTYAVYFNLSRSNTIQNNTARNSNYGVYLLNSTSNILSGNRAYNNSVSELYSSNSSGNTMSDFRITTLSFLSIDMSGDLSFKEGNLTGVTMPTTYANISKETLNITNSTANAWTTINLTYNDTGIDDESTLIIAHYSNGEWVTDTSDYTSSFSVNETSNYIYANITDFSMYMIMSPAVAEEVASSTGGGGFPSTTYETDLDSVENFVLRISDAVFFPFRGNQHKLRILNMGVGSVYLEVSSDPVKINIASGETKNVDLDSDGTDDISIYLEKIENNKAYITVTAINTDESDDAVLTDETIEDVKEELDISEDDIEIIKQTDDTIELVIEIDKDELPIIYGIVALAFAFIVAGWYFYKKDKV